MTSGDPGTVAYFDQNAPRYSVGRVNPVIDFIRSHARDDSTLIDVGCGAGNVLEHILSSTRISRVSGMDVTPSYVNDLRNRLDAELILGSILDDQRVQAMPSFDFVLIAAVLHHLVGQNRRESRENAERALRNCLRLTRPGGYLMITEPAFYPALAMDLLFHVKRLLSRVTSRRIELLGKWNNIGAPVVSYYNNEELQRMLIGLESCEVVRMEAREVKLHPLVRAAGVRRRTETTLIVRRTGHG